MKYLFDIINEDYSYKDVEVIEPIRDVIVTAVIPVLEKILDKLPSDIFKAQGAAHSPIIEDFRQRVPMSIIKSYPNHASLITTDLTAIMLNVLNHAIDRKNPKYSNIIPKYDIYPSSVAWSKFLNKLNVGIPTGILSNKNISKLIGNALITHGYHFHSKSNYDTIMILGKGLGQSGGVDVEELLKYIRAGKLAVFRAKHKLSLPKIFSIIFASYSTLRDEDKQYIINWLNILDKNVKA